MQRAAIVRVVYFVMDTHTLLDSYSQCRYHNMEFHINVVRDEDVLIAEWALYADVCEYVSE